LIKEITYSFKGDFVKKSEANCFRIIINYLREKMDDQRHSSMTWPRETKEIPWPDRVPIMTPSMSGGLTFVFDVHFTRKFAPDPPALSASVNKNNTNLPKIWSSISQTKPIGAG
jgi:hypothetical protein